MVKAINYKNWCVENISPQSWSRIVLKSIPEIRSSGLDLKDLENPTDKLELDDTIMDALNKALDDLYQLKIEGGVLT